MVTGHRGIKSQYPENTLLSFQKVLVMNVDMIEMDLNLTYDKEIVIIHDNTIDRTTNGTGFAHDFTLKKLKEFDAGGWFDSEFTGLTIPTFVEFCELIKPYKNLLLNIEIKEKTHETVDLAMKIVNEYDLENRSVFTCSDAEILSYMADKYNAKTQGFHESHMSNFVKGENNTYTKMYAIAFDMKSITPEIVEEFESMGLLPWAYCPDTDDEVYKALTCSARLVTVNNPEPALRIFKEKGFHK